MYEAVFGPDGEPEKGLKAMHVALEKDARPLIRLWNAAKWPLGILGAGLLTWGLNWVISAVKAVAELIP